MTTVDLSPILTPLIQIAGLILTGVVGWVGIKVANYAHVSTQSTLFQNVLAAADRGIAYGQQVASTAVAKDATVNFTSAQQAAAASYVVDKMSGTLKALGITPASVADIVLAKLPPATPETIPATTPPAVQDAAAAATAPDTPVPQAPPAPAAPAAPAVVVVAAPPAPTA